MRAFRTIGVLQLGLAASLVASPLAGEGQTRTGERWNAAVYHGLTVGKSSKEEMVSVLGAPIAIGKEQDTGIPTATYEVSEPVRGTLIVFLKGNTVDGMTLIPEQRIQLADITKRLGPHPQRIRYATADCLTEGGSAPIYESRNGPIEHIEYRSQGIAIILHEGVIHSIAFVHKPFGPRHSPCPGKN